MANTEHRTLEIVQAAATIIINQKIIEHQGGGIDRYIRIMLPQQCENAVLSLVELFAADNIRNIEIRHPANWWEALKEAFLPEILVERWPVKYKTYIVDIKAIWQGYRPPPGTDKYGPFLPYVLQRTNDDTKENL